MGQSTVKIVLPTSIGGLRIPTNAANTPMVRKLAQQAEKAIDKEFLQNSSERPTVISSVNSQMQYKVEVRQASPALKQQMEKKLNVSQK